MICKAGDTTQAAGVPVTHALVTAGAIGHLTVIGSDGVYVRKLEELADSIGQCLRMLRRCAVGTVQTSFLIEAVCEHCTDIFGQRRTLAKDLAKLLFPYLASNHRCQRDETTGLFNANQQAALAEDIAG